MLTAPNRETIQIENNKKILDLLRRANKDKSQNFKVWGDRYDAREVFSIELQIYLKSIFGQARGFILLVNQR